MATSARTATGSLRATASPARRWVRRLGTALLLCGLAAVAWTATVWLWQDPATGLYTWYEQRKLSSSLEQQFADPLNRIQFHVARGTGVAAEERAVAAAAARPLVATAGTPLRPRDRVRFAPYHWLRVATAPERPRPGLARAREEYAAELALGVEYALGW